MIEPESLESRRTHGRLSFGWYRIAVTIPEKVGALDTAGSTVVFEIVVDDYAEVWVDGKLPIALGQAGGQFIKGFNAPNRVVIARDAVPGQRIQLAVFGANGPLSNPPGNFVWVRSATLDFYKTRSHRQARRSEGRRETSRPGLDAIVPEDLTIEKLADGFIFTEGPVWVPDGYLLFSDPNANTIYRWSPDGQVSVFRTKSGYAGIDIGEYGQPGSNGITLDRGRTRHDRRARQPPRRPHRKERHGDRPRRSIRRASGSTAPTTSSIAPTAPCSSLTRRSGLPKAFDDTRKELPFSGVYSLKDGTLAARCEGSDRAQRSRVLSR